MKLLHIIADYAAGDLAFSEMISALARHLPADYNWHPTAVHSFDTVGTGFIVAQLGLQQESLRAPSTVIYANCAPRKDRREARKNNSGEGLLYGVLTNGVPIVVVNSGYSLSFVRDNLAELWEVDVPRSGSQFRSRDLFPPIVGKVARGELDFLKGRLDPQEVIADIPRQVVCYVDSFGNLKTSFRDGQDEVLAKLQPGDRFGVRINQSRPISVTVASGSFNV
ncbi:MAG: SAM-dependent chlorinase/fluorinase, partial [Deltaproteobacteria bacterium]|nr:SAM-dependent chlorinase/fluorinase [Deltaproteobacteria bacterium]